MAHGMNTAMINAAEKPVLYVGQGCVLSGGAAALTQAARQANIPVTTTLQGLGAFDEKDPLSLHMLGMHGSAYANWAMRDADCIIAVGHSVTVVVDAVAQFVRIWVDERVVVVAVVFCQEAV